MKKTLIALAAVAAATAASAQVTVSGYLALGYKTSETSAGVKSTGFGTDDAVITFGATEDLGGGLKLSGSASLESLEKGGAGAGAGSTLALESAYGKLTMSSVEAADYLPVDGLTTNADGTIGDRVTYALPKFGDLALSVSYKDGGATSVTGYGFGADLNTSSSTSVTAAYAKGPLSLSATYQWTPNGSTIDSRIYAKAAYDFGIAQVTAGVVSTDKPAGSADNTETGVTVAMPVGPLAVTASWATSKDTGVTAKNGFALGASYALSKRTAVAFYTETYETSSRDASESKIELQHSF